MVSGDMEREKERGKDKGGRGKKGEKQERRRRRKGKENMKNMNHWCVWKGNGEREGMREDKDRGRRESERD